MTTKKAVLSSLIVPVIATTLLLGVFKLPLTRVDKAGLLHRLTTSDVVELKNREKILVKFFIKNKSPFAVHARKFVEISDQYNIDYRLLPAIACTESSCGKFLIKSSYNPFGWGIYGNKVTSFASYDEAIEKVGEGISKNYIAKGFDTPEKIGHIYNPNTPTAWSGHTRFFMNQMDEIAFSLN